MYWQVGMQVGRVVFCSPRYQVKLLRTRHAKSLGYATANEPPTASSSEEGHSTKKLYLHVGPSGDAWTGYSLYAAKHLQPDYVKSLPLDATAVNEENVDLFLELLEDDLNEGGDWAQTIYDNGRLPEELQQTFSEEVQKDE